MSPRSQKSPMNFRTISQIDVPQGRNGKHKAIVTRILSDLDQLKEGVALKVPLAELAEGKEKVRAALNRATHKGARNVATATDVNYLYVWKPESNSVLPLLFARCQWVFSVYARGQIVESRRSGAKTKKSFDAVRINIR